MTIKPIPLLPVPSAEATRPDTVNPPALPKRKRGGQPGNKNRLVHGFYSSLFTDKESRSLESNVKGEFQDELSLLYILINRTVQSMNSDPQMAFDEYLASLRTVTQAIARIESLRRSQRFLYSNQTTIEKALEELAFIPPEED